MENARPQNPLPVCARHPLELPTAFVLFDSAFAISWKVLYVEMRVLVEELNDGLKGALVISYV